ncbi:ribulose-phosphate 3-epimerase [uncultured Mailhella sp.]|uniref:ribulose-phosphate 3-epimerase n=1 Tax=uncultured Mailhella sp. TaxID=1981031 RepID=UPI0025CD5CE1|nr:ribulose-phosphate 3-epimerase [uncultured Mailhella sp.]
MILSPSLLSADCGHLAETLKNLEEAGVKWVHWDVMDGQFVPNITFGQHVIKGLRPASGLFFDVHLMIESPERYLADFKAAGADMLVVHAEATVHLQRTLAEIRRLGMKAGAALNPATPLSVLDYVLDDLDMVLVMSVNPGFGGQKFLPATLRKVAELRAKLNDAGRSDCLIQVDGGVNLENTGALVQAGANVLVSGSAFFGHPPFSERLAAFTAAAC